jgi:hypothetical protein
LAALEWSTAAELERVLIAYVSGLSSIDIHKQRYRPKLAIDATVNLYKDMDAGSRCVCLGFKLNIREQRYRPKLSIYATPHLYMDMASNGADLDRQEILNGAMLVLLVFREKQIQMIFFIYLLTNNCTPERS